MKTKVTSAVVLAACLCTAAVGAQARSETLFVVRHDPSLIRLDWSMLSWLLGEERLANARAAVDGYPADDVVEARIGVPTGVEQPPGVFVGTLTVSSRHASPEQVARLSEFVVDLLRTELTERLHERPFRRLRQELDEVEAALDAVTSHVDRRGAGEALAQRVDALRAELQEASVEAASGESMQKVLAAQLDEAQVSLNALRIQLDKLRPTVEELRVEIEQLERRAAEYASSALIEKLRLLTRELTPRMAELETLEQRVVANDERVSRLATALDDARAQFERGRARRAALEDQLTAAAEQLTALRAAGSPTDLQLRFDTLARQRERLTERLHALRPLELEVWR